MSKISEKSPKHCANKHEFNFHMFNKKKLFCSFTAVFISLLSFIFIVWLILHPTKPQFSIKEAEVNQLKLSGPSLLNSSIQLTLLSTNPNKRVGIYYDEFSLYASYKGQRITPQTSISPFFQAHEETNLLSASLVGSDQPMAPSFVYQIQRDEGTGTLAISFKVLGKLRWKVGTWISGQYRIIVNCIHVMPFGSIPLPPLISTQGSECSTTI